MVVRCVEQENKILLLKADSHKLLVTHVAVADGYVSAAEIENFLYFHMHPSAACVKRSSCESAFKFYAHSRNVKFGQTEQTGVQAFKKTKLSALTDTPDIPWKTTNFLTVPMPASLSSISVLFTIQ